MEQNFQTSFIPKKPIIEDTVKPKKSMSFLTVFTVILFLSVVLSFGGLYFYQTVLAQNIKTQEETLNRANQRFEVSTVSELQTLDKRLKASNKILDQHITISPIFKVLQDITMKSVRYTQFSYEIAENDVILVKMSGEAEGYRAIALQADLFSANKNLKDPVFYNLSLQEKGGVIFDLDFSVDPSLVNYKQTLEKERPTAPTQTNVIPAGAGEEN
ncbi:MAG: hypothetical protein WC011_01695 [Candidatus Paceibacterota bacterium]